jgi:hypothetical protein
MKVTSRLAKFLQNLRDQFQNPYYWQKKYFSLVENLTLPALEINNLEIVHINKAAKELLKISSFSNNLYVNEIFEGYIVLENDKNSPFDLQLKSNKEIYRASVYILFSARNYIITLSHSKDRKLENLNESALINGDETYLEIFNSFPDSIYLHDIETNKLIDVNQTVVDRYGYTKEELLNLQIEDFIHKKKPMNC